MDEYNIPGMGSQHGFVRGNHIQQTSENVNKHVPNGNIN